MIENPKCCETIYRDWSRWPCKNKGKVKHGDKWYCGVHDPAKAEALDAKYRRKMDLKGQRNAVKSQIFDAGCVARPDLAEQLAALDAEIAAL